MSVVGFELQWLVNGREASDGGAVLERIGVAFERSGDEVKDFEKYLWPKVTAALETDVRRQFAEQGGGPARGSWVELSPDYAAWKAKNYPGQPILQRTGAMYRALTDGNDPHALRASAGSDTFEFGTRGLEYPSFHQLGTIRMVDRPPFDFGSDFQRDLQQAGMDAVREALRAARMDEFAEVS